MSINEQTPANEPFLKHLNVQKTPHVILTAEDDEFDETWLSDLRAEGFNVAYLAQGDDAQTKYTNRIHAVADKMTGVSERYAIVGKITLGPPPLYMLRCGFPIVNMNQRGQNMYRD